MVVADEVVLHALGHAAQHAEDETAPFLLLGMERVEAVVNLVLGILSHRAGVEKHGVGVSLHISGFIASHLHDGRNNF